jgi:hypothetical protein
MGAAATSLTRCGEGWGGGGQPHRMWRRMVAVTVNLAGGVEVWGRRWTASPKAEKEGGRAAVGAYLSECSSVLARDEAEENVSGQIPRDVAREWFIRERAS